MLGDRPPPSAPAFVCAGFTLALGSATPAGERGATDAITETRGDRRTDGWGTQARWRLCRRILCQCLRRPAPRCSRPLSSTYVGCLGHCTGWCRRRLQGMCLRRRRRRSLPTAVRIVCWRVRRGEARRCCARRPQASRRRTSQTEVRRRCWNRIQATRTARSRRRWSDASGRSASG